MSSSRLRASAVFGAIGVVYGDIGTSPLYAFGAAIKAADHLSLAFATLGSLSLIFWSLVFVVSVKYLVVVVRADNEGEGGILALLARLEQHSFRWGRWSRYLLLAGALGAALFYCDAAITPAISVLSAVEGLEVLNPRLEQYVLPLACGILVGLFLIQRSGTHSVSRYFGPVMLLWFGSLAVTGVLSIARTPQILHALNPLYAVGMLAESPSISLAIIGAVFLAVTGGEALYADMGHFGRGAVRTAWFGFVWPALVLNYLGQGANAIRNPATLENPFFRMVPEPLLASLIVLATAATIIASQATITGAYSVTRQAVQLDLMPRVEIIQTSARERGQIYVPVANWVLLAFVLLITVGFGSSGALSAAYGAAVAGTMFITTVLAATLARLDWKWPWVAIVLVFGTFIALDTVFVAGNLTKIADGAWVPLTMAAAIFLVFIVWHDGRVRLGAQLDGNALSMAELPKLLKGTTQVGGTAIFLASRPDSIPSAFLRNLEHNRVVHESVVFLHIGFRRVPKVDEAARLDIDTLRPGFYSVRAHYGFMEDPDVMAIIQQCNRQGLRIFARDYTLFLGQHVVVPLEQRRARRWQREFFAWLQRRSVGAAEFFGMPLRRVVILSTVVEI
ncbi:MAG: KUP/HAK/KT family potassium transporter [Gammaproteobacteria bacterium]|nr:KUP/HAK/KT family potassium transporter [Gammaproteobacteria bacterium]